MSPARIMGGWRTLPHLVRALPVPQTAAIEAGPEGDILIPDPMVATCTCRERGPGDKLKGHQDAGRHMAPPPPGHPPFQPESEQTEPPRVPIRVGDRLGGRVRDTDTELAVDRPECNRDRRLRRRPKSGLHEQQFIEDEAAEEQGGQPAQHGRPEYAFPRHHHHPSGSSQVVVAGETVGGVDGGTGLIGGEGGGQGAGAPGATHVDLDGDGGGRSGRVVCPPIQG